MPLKKPLCFLNVVIILHGTKQRTITESFKKQKDLIDVIKRRKT